MCRSIRPLFNFDPPATPDEIHEASLQFVRKLSGFKSPSKSNEIAFNHAVTDISLITQKLMHSLQTTSTPKNREIESQKAKERSIKRFGSKI